jgi:hypothetical protein
MIISNRRLAAINGFPILMNNSEFGHPYTFRQWLRPGAFNLLLRFARK